MKNLIKKTTEWLQFIIVVTASIIMMPIMMLWLAFKFKETSRKIYDEKIEMLQVIYDEKGDSTTEFVIRELLRPTMPVMKLLSFAMNVVLIIIFISEASLKAASIPFEKE